MSVWTEKEILHQHRISHWHHLHILPYVITQCLKRKYISDSTKKSSLYSITEVKHYPAFKAIYLKIFRNLF